MIASFAPIMFLRREWREKAAQPHPGPTPSNTAGGLCSILSNRSDVKPGGLQRHVARVGGRDAPARIQRAATR